MTAPSNANTSGLAPCPFCGGEAWLNDYEAKYSDLPPMSRAPQCRSCGASLGYLTTPAKATEAWNRRVTAASATAAEARAGRLAKALVMLGGEKTEQNRSYPNSYRGGFDAATDLAASIARAALQQETQP